MSDRNRERLLKMNFWVCEVEGKVAVWFFVCNVLWFLVDGFDCLCDFQFFALFHLFRVAFQCECGVVFRHDSPSMLHDQDVCEIAVLLKISENELLNCSA